MTVKELMRTRNLVTVGPDDDSTVAAQIFGWADVRHLPVVDGTRVIGVLSEHDLLRHNAGAKSRAGSAVVRSLMSSPAEVVNPDDDVALACAVMLARKIDCLPVVEGDELVGILTTTDVVGRQIAARLEVPGAASIEIAMKRDPATVAPQASLLEAVAILVNDETTHVVVVDDQRRVVGIVSDGDVRTAVGDPVEALHEELPELEELKISTVMSNDVLTVRNDSHLADVARLFVEERVGAIPVVDGQERLIGLVTSVDVIRSLLALGSGSPVLNQQSPHIDRRSPSRSTAPAPH